MRFLLVLLISFLLFITACSSSQNQETPEAKLKRYDLTGKVISVNRSKGEAAIAHDEIPGYMAAMTMDFPIKDKDILNDLTPGAEITGILVVDNPNGTYWLEIKGMVAKPGEDQKPLPVKEGVATIDKKIIDFSLTDQDGNDISPKDFQGKVWALTFIYAQCPLPNFCILMSKNFSEAANTIAGDPGLKDKMQLLSISFDPNRDTPEKLKKYKLGYLGKDSKALETDIWQVAVGPDEKVRKIADFFGLDYKVNENDKTQFDHSLRTIVIDEDGTIKKIILGNEWNAEDLLREMKKAGKNK
jgi:protein SCO1/2